MRVSTKFPIAVHALVMIAMSTNGQKITSQIISRSTGVNAVTIRNILKDLKKNGMISMSPGPGGTIIAKKAEDITLWDIYTVVENIETTDIFKFHQNVSVVCPVGSNINGILQNHLSDAITALQKELSSVTLATLLDDISHVVSMKAYS